MGSSSYSTELVWEIGTKSVLYCFRKVKWVTRQEFNIRYKLHLVNILGLVASKAKSSGEDPHSIPGRAIIHQFFDSDIVNFLLNMNGER